MAKIARGGMASVYLGRMTSPEGEERFAAVKAIRPELAQDAQFIAMFTDEAKILSRLDHPNVIRTLEYGIEGSHPFIAMELLLGRTLLDVWDQCVLKGVPLPLKLAAWVCARVAEGLHHAHELCDAEGTWLNIVHRDVNPSNIFLTYDGDVKLFDFGLARAKGRRHRTESGVVKGKIAYLSPEQLNQLPIDRRCDIFALGTTLWELTTMRRLFKKDADLATVMAIQEARVPDPRELIRGYPAELSRIVGLALAKDREERFQRAEDMASDLDDFVGEVAISQMAPRVGTLLDELFPGDRERQNAWLRMTKAAPFRGAQETIAPPALLPSVNIPTNADRQAAKIMSQYIPGVPKSRRPPPK
jgi:serine/threonine-protein kinase